MEGIEERGKEKEDKKRSVYVVAGGLDPKQQQRRSSGISRSRRNLRYWMLNHHSSSHYAGLTRNRDELEEEQPNETCGVSGEEGECGRKWVGGRMML